MKSAIHMLLLACCAVHAATDSEKITLAPIEELERSDLYLWRPDGPLCGVLVYCPGYNASGESFVGRVEWRAFATANKVAICGLSFSSGRELTDAGKGYTYAERGSGRLLLEALEGRLGDREIPLLLYGVSAGARFVTSFAAWKQDRLRGWCAVGVSTWPALPGAAPGGPPGVVACGEYDAACYWASLHYFQAGRAAGRPWAWVSVKSAGHGDSKELDSFAMRFFETAIAPGQRRPGAAFFDITTKRALGDHNGVGPAIFAARLPADPQLIELWLQVHSP